MLLSMRNPWEIPGNGKLEITLEDLLRYGSILYHEDLEKRGGCDVVAQKRHESHVSQ